LPPRRVERKTASFFTLVLNTFMLVSALLLTFVVLVREEQYAFGQPDDPAPIINSKAPQTPPDLPGASVVLPPG
jgi:hypothetical protein